MAAAAKGAVAQLIYAVHTCDAFRVVAESEL